MPDCEETPTAPGDKTDLPDRFTYDSTILRHFLDPHLRRYLAGGLDPEILYDTDYLDEELDPKLSCNTGCVGSKLLRRASRANQVPLGSKSQLADFLLSNLFAAVNEALSHGGCYPDTLPRV